MYSPFCQILQGDFNVLSMTKLLAMSLNIKHNPHHSLEFQWQESARKLQEVKPFTFWGVPSFKVHPFWGGLGNQKMLDTQTTWKILENNENSRFLQTNLTILGRIQDGGIQWLSPVSGNSKLFEPPQPLPMTQNVYNLVLKKVQGWVMGGCPLGPGRESEVTILLDGFSCTGLPSFGVQGCSI